METEHTPPARPVLAERPKTLRKCDALELQAELAWMQSDRARRWASSRCCRPNFARLVEMLRTERRHELS